MKVNKELILKVGSIAMCVMTGVSAFFAESDKRQAEKTLKDLTERVSKLENK